MWCVLSLETVLKRKELSRRTKVKVVNASIICTLYNVWLRDAVPDKAATIQGTSHPR